MKRLKKIRLKKVYRTPAIKFKEQLCNSDFTCSAKTEQVPTIHVEATEPMPIYNTQKGE